MNRRTLIRQVCIVAAAFCALMAVSFPTQASAQIKCACDAVLIASSSNIPCGIPICLLDAAGNIVYCETIKPGADFKMKCSHGGNIAIKDCNGKLVPITQDCVTVHISTGCCVYACLFYDDQGCITIKIGPSPVRCRCL